MAELDKIIAERLDRLQQLGVTGADLVIATVGAGLRALTRYERVEQDNGETLPAERFLAVVQGRVLDAIFGALTSADPVTRYYLAAQYSYGYAAVPFDEANNLARMTGVDLDSQHGLTGGRNALVLKQGVEGFAPGLRGPRQRSRAGASRRGERSASSSGRCPRVALAGRAPAIGAARLPAGRPARQRAAASGHSGPRGQGTALRERRREVTGGRRCRTPAGLLAAICRGHPVRIMKEIAGDSDATGNRVCEPVSSRAARNGIESISKQPCPEPSHE